MAKRQGLCKGLEKLFSENDTEGMVSTNTLPLS